MKTKTNIILMLALFLALPLVVSADYGGQQTSFFVDSDYDLLGREKLTATLIRISPHLYFYLDNNWWSAVSAAKQSEIKTALQNLEEEFEKTIYPILTAAFGTEWRPGIDKDVHLIILIHPIEEQAGGYISTGDEYSKLQVPNSNQREMIYLNSKYITSPLAKSFLAHEFTHLITFNQKEVKRGVTEEIWLNEGRAEYAPTLLGYDSPYIGSNLQTRVRDFLQNPQDSLTEWRNDKADYGVLNLFIQYLVDYYGIEILVDSLHSKKIGIPSLNEALAKNGYDQDFSQIFTDWTIAVLLNDCSIKHPMLSEQSETTSGVESPYCYLNPNLKNVRVSPSLNFLPFVKKTTLAVTATSKNWAANWYKFIGGQGDLKLEFIGYPDITFKIPYLTQDLAGEYSLDFFELDEHQQGQILIPDFGQKITSLVIIPSIQSKMSGFDADEDSYSFFWSVSSEEESNTPPNEEEEPAEDIQSLLEKISFLEKQLTLLRAQLKTQLAPTPLEVWGLAGPQALEYNLQYEDRGEEIKLLQTWLAKDPFVYPEGLVTGYFGPLTKAAVIRFQERFPEEVLSPWGLTQGTGFVGPTTRTKLNELYTS